MLVNLLEFGHEVFDRALLELAQADPGIAGFQHFAAHRLRTDLLARDRHRKSAVLVFAENSQQDLGPGLAAHFLDGLVQGETFDKSVINFGDQVVGLEAGTVCRRAFDRRDHFHQAVFLADFDADADKAASCALPEFFEGLFVKINRVRVQTGDHA